MADVGVWCRAKQARSRRMSVKLGAGSLASAAPKEHYLGGFAMTLTAGAATGGVEENGFPSAFPGANPLRHTPRAQCIATDS